MRFVWMLEYAADADVGVLIFGMAGVPDCIILWCAC